MLQQRKSQSPITDSECMTFSSFPTLSHTAVSTFQIRVQRLAVLRSFLGMENSCLTFATPSVIAGDRSAVDVCAHEISHVRLQFSLLGGVSILLILISRGSVMALDALRGVISGLMRVGQHTSSDY